VRRGRTYTISSMTFDIKKAKKISNSPLINPKQINGPNIYQFYLPAAKTFYIKVGSSKDTEVKILNNSETKVFGEKVAASEESYKTIKVTLNSGFYTLRLGQYYQFTRVEFPADITFFSTGTLWYTNGGYPLLYV